MPFQLPDPDGGPAEIVTPPPPARPPSAAPVTRGLRVILSAAQGLTPSGLFSGPLLMQAPPTDQFQESHVFNHDDYATAFAGERSRPAGRQLVDISFDTVWVDDGSESGAPSWAVARRTLNPLEAKDLFIELGRTGKPFWLLVHQMPIWKRYDLRMMVTLRSFTPQEKAGEEDARYFSIQLKEFLPAVVATRVKGKGAPHGTLAFAGGGGVESVSSVSPNTDPVVDVTKLGPTENTLHKLAVKYSGSVQHWRAIAVANGLSGVAPSTDLVEYFRKVKAPPKLTIPRPKVGG